MLITLKMHASLSDYLPPRARGLINAVDLDVPEDTTVASLIERFKVPVKSVHLVLVNGVYLPPAERASASLKEHDVIAMWPPIAGG
jgi:sulfur carrier protein ThiS